MRRQIGNREGEAIGLLTGRPVQFDITSVTRQAVHEWIHQAELGSDD